VSVSAQSGTTTLRDAGHAAEQLLRRLEALERRLAALAEKLERQLKEAEKEVVGG